MIQFHCDIPKLIDIPNNLCFKSYIVFFLQAYDEIIGKLKKEMEDRSSSMIDITTQSEHHSPEANSTSTSRRTLLQDVRISPKNKSTSRIHSYYDSDEFYSSKYTEELSSLQQKDHQSSTDAHPMSSKRYEIKDSDENASENYSKILSEIEVANDVEKTQGEVTPEISIVEEKSEIITEVDEIEEQSDIVTEEEKSAIITEEENSEIKTKSEIVTEVHDTNSVFAEGDASLVPTQIEGKSQTLRTKSASISQAEEYSHLFSEPEEKSYVATELEDKHESITEPEENVQINTDNELYEINTEVEEEKSPTDAEEQEKSVINSEIEEEEFVVDEENSQFTAEEEEEEKENSEIGTETEQHSDEKHLEIPTKLGKVTFKEDSEIKFAIEEVISEFGEDAEMLSEKEKSDILSEALAMQGVISEDENEENYAKELVESGFKIIEIAEENKKEVEKLSSAESIPEVVVDLESKYTHDKSEKDQEGSIEENLSYQASDSEGCREEIMSSKEKSSSISNRLVLVHEKSEEKVISPDKLEMPGNLDEEKKQSEENVDILSSNEKSSNISSQLISVHEKSKEKIISLGTLKISGYQEEEKQPDKTEDTSSDVVSSIMEEVSESSDKKFNSDSENTKKKKLVLEKADKITDAILKKILCESIISLCKKQSEIILNDETENGDLIGDMKENEKQVNLNETYICETENNYNENSSVHNTDQVENITNLIFNELLRDSTKIAYENKNKMIYSNIVEDSSSEHSSSDTLQKGKH